MELLGRGGFAEVWAEGEIAHKRYYARDPERCAREARLQARAAPLAPAVLALRLDGEQPVIEMERVRGLPLDVWFAAEPDRAGALLGVARRLAAALLHLQERGIVHRDLKPANLLIGEDGELHVLDFGLARLLDETEAEGRMVTAAERRLGTPLYMAPEQIRRSPLLDARTDVYAWGGTLHALWRGAPPFSAERCIEGHLFHAPPPLVGIDRRLDELVQTCLAKDLADRPTAAQLLERLITIAAAPEPPPTVTAMPPSAMPAAEIPAPPLPADPTSGSTPPPAPTPPLLGRARELTALVAAVKEALAGRSRLIVMSGERGMGRTRLLDELHRALPDVSLVRFDAAAGHGAPPPSTLRGPLVVAVDNGEKADDTFFDAVESHLVAGGAGVACVVAARPALERRRPHWKTLGALLLPLSPLDNDAAEDLLRRLLLPAERIPAPLVGGWLRAAEGVPARLAEIAHLLRAAAMRRHHGASGWFIAAELAEAGERPMVELARHALQAAHPSLAALLRLFAVVGASAEEAVLQGVADQAAGEGEARPSVAAMLPWAEGARLVAREHKVWRFAAPGLAAAIYAESAPSERARLHAAALRWWQQEPEGDARDAQLARHAAALGDHREAALRWLALGRRARRRCDDLGAESALTEALQEAADAQVRFQALLERGRARIRCERISDALSDFAAARPLAPSDGQRAQLFLDEATAHDWANDYAAAEQATDAADRCAAAAETAPLALARGRCLYRRERFSESLPLFDEAVRRAVAQDDGESEIVARVLIAYAQSMLEQFDSAERSYAELFRVCERRGDRFHAGVAHANRVAMHVVRHDHARARLDLEAALSAARELGHVKMESFSRINLAHLLLWSGDLDGAFLQAQHGVALAALSQAQPEPEDALLLLRIAVARGDFESARPLHTALAVDSEQMKPSVRALHRAFGLALDGVPANAPAWDEVVAGGTLLPDEVSEIERLRARGRTAPIP